MATNGSRVISSIHSSSNFDCICRVRIATYADNNTANTDSHSRSLVILSNVSRHRSAILARNKTKLRISNHKNSFKLVQSNRSTLAFYLGWFIQCLRVQWMSFTSNMRMTAGSCQIAGAMQCGMRVYACVIPEHDKQRHLTVNIGIIDEIILSFIRLFFHNASAAMLCF